MSDLADGQSIEVQGSAASPYVLKNTGGAYSCTCPAWRNQSPPPERRTCKHLIALRGRDAEEARIGDLSPARAARAAKSTGVASGGDAPDDGPPILLAERWESHMDLAGWWMSEKLDGVRAYWDGAGFVTRLGNAFFAPAWFTAGLPAEPLDGELWGGRKRFQRTVSIARRQDRGEAWRELEFLVFDAPGLIAPFEQRIEHCRALLARSALPHVRLLEHRPCLGEEDLRAELARVERLGGEGLMLRKPGSLYVAGRSSTLLKVKSFLDAEARVLAHVPGKGRHKGRLGALLVELADGTRFNVGTGFSDEERRAPPPVGSVITYRYQELSDGGVPRFPSYLGIRDDVAFIATNHEETLMPTKSKATTATTSRLEIADGSGRRFFEVAIHDAQHTVTEGRIEVTRSETTTFADAATAARDAEDLLALMRRRGFADVGTPTHQSAPVAVSAPAPAAPKRVAAKGASPAAAPPATAVDGGLRRFELEDGTSSKFWEIAVAESAHTVRYGRLGTAGQSKTKDFPSAAAAERDAEKLVAEKVKKGYVEVGGGARGADDDESDENE